MSLTEWLRAALIGLVIGAGLTAFLGFSYGGWTTAAAAETLATAKAKLDVATALAPYCVEKAKADPTYASKLDAFKAGTSYNQIAIIQIRVGPLSRAQPHQMKPSRRRARYSLLPRSSQRGVQLSTALSGV